MLLYFKLCMKVISIYIQNQATQAHAINTNATQGNQTKPKSQIHTKKRKTIQPTPQPLPATSSPKQPL